MTKTAIKKERFFYVPEGLDLTARLFAIGEQILTKPIHLEKFYYVIDNLYLRIVTHHAEWETYLGLHSRILIKILTSRWASQVKTLLIETNILEKNPNCEYRNGYYAKQYRFTEKFRGTPFRRVPATDLKLVERIQKAHEFHRIKSVGDNPAKLLIQKSLLSMSFDATSAREFVATHQYDTADAKNRRFILIDYVVNMRTESFSTDGAGRFYHALVGLARELRAFASWKGKPLYSVDVSNCQPALHSLLYPSNCEEKRKYVSLVSTNTFYFFINERLQVPFDLTRQKEQFKNAIFHYIFYGSPYAKEKEMQKVFGREFPILNSLIRQAKRYNTTDLPVRFQKVEADIVLNKVATEFALLHKDQDICLISIHDALVTTQEHTEEIRLLMSKHFLAVLGFEVLVKVTRMTQNVIT